MKLLLCLLAAMVLFAPAAPAQSPAKGARRHGAAEQQILALNRAWADAMVRGDMATLESLFADDLIVTSGDGTLRDKAGELADVKPTPDLTTYFFNTEDVRVRVYKDAAVLTGRAKWRISFKGRDIDNERRYTSVYVKQQGRWRMVALHISRVAPRPA